MIAPRHGSPRGYTRGVIHGSLDRLHLGDLLQWLQMGRLTGRLTLRDGRLERRLDLLEGRIVYASSAAPEERLATWLANDGMAPPAVLRQMLGVSVLQRRLFTDLLVDAGYADAESLRASIAQLAGIIVSRVLAAETLDFTFDPAYPVRDLLALSLDIEPHTLLMDAARQRDEAGLTGAVSPVEPLPFAGEEFERFFWSLIRRGISEEDRLDGDELASLHRLVRDIMGTLAQWLASSPGLVPLPSMQASAAVDQLGREGAVRLAGMAHGCWNQMVLACAIRHPALAVPTTLAELETAADELDLWVEMTGSERWRRPHAARLDELTRSVVTTWSRAAAVAAPHLGVEPGTAVLAVHLVTVPTDLVLWVLSTLSLSHQRLRHALLCDLSRRVGAALTQRAGFPAELQSLFEPGDATPLGVCLHLGREQLPSAPVWLATAPEDESGVLAVVPAGRLTAAATAVRAEFADAQLAV